MTQAFDSFVIFAEMRTGSNFLETNLNAFAGITCHGEAFNPHFIGYPDNKPILGIDQKRRDAKPGDLLDAIRGDRATLGGFRYFHDHDPRIFDDIIADRRCAKIILTRNPVESYVSWKIAQATGQWKLTNVKSRKAALARFDPDEFGAHLTALQDFQIKLLNRLQTSGQTAFYIAYEDLQNLDVMNGLAAFLGIDERLDALDRELKKQNPSPVTAKVSNPYDMVEALARLDRFDLTRTPNFEPRRGPVVPSYVAAAQSPLLYLPLRGGPEAQVVDWLARLDGVAQTALHRKMNQKELRRWKRQRPGHRSFTVLRHPLARAHHAFCRHILGTGPESYLQLRQTLIRQHGLPLPENGPDATYDIAAHRAAFVTFLTFLKANLSGQTAIRVDAAWCSQSAAVQGFGELLLPDRIIREEELGQQLHELARSVGHGAAPSIDVAKASEPFTLDDIYDEEIESLGQAAYQRDYLMFGFGPWR
ncbi:nodulation protein NodH [Sulfitobacter aestuarii]|uniref:Nodulation protein NodH n=1 Tax=Sulfitobacter aestuarii TaxID=2161676 RepID=A0ABW5U0N5_9RHOB